ncbi:hypothetical protein A2229_02185 [Candidatus Peregrinibacteria bacterium RIFOXYA2_FULL_33_7]|nr:MAG: hypothetical protein A2229_02185 [Candidatus Peregrinibacteria bacterium RIFOXYA2_FULL_33_7]
MKKCWKKLVCCLIFVSCLILPQMSFAQGKTILPEEKPEGVTCEEMVIAFGEEIYLMEPEDVVVEIGSILYCAVQTGKIHAWMVPYFIRYLAEFLIGIAGIICMLFIVIGGYQYMIGGFVEEKEKGKNTIKYAVIGLALVFLSWAIVNVMLYVFTS